LIRWEKEIKTKRTGYFSALIISVIIATLFGIFGIIIEIITTFNTEQRILFWSILALFFAIFMPLLVPTQKTRTIKLIGKQDKLIEIIKEIEKPVLKIIEKPVVEYKEKPKRKLNIPKYNFLGSNDTLTYHKHGCRFSKLIKAKHKLSNNDETFFKKAGFKKCKICLDNK